MKIFQNILLALALATTLSVTAQNYPQKTINGQKFYEYTMEKQEGFFALYRKFGIRQEDVLKYNPEAKDGLKLGQKILIPIPEDKKESQKQEFIEHVALKKQTIYSISKLYNVAIDSIYKYNPETRTSLQEGYIIKIPVYDNNTAEQSSKDEKKADKSEKQQEKEQQNTPYKKEQRTIQFDSKDGFHTVQAGETIYSIAQSYNISADELLELNPFVKENNISEGEILRVLPFVQQSQIIANARPATKLKKYADEFGRPLKIAFLLPFMLDKEGLDAAAGKFYEFYQGALIAIDSLKKQGVSMNLYVYDTDRSDDKIQKVLARPELREVDFIIGPAYTTHVKAVSAFAKANNIRLIVPFSLHPDETLVNPLIFQCNIGGNLLEEEIIQRFDRDFRDKNIILLRFPNKSAQMEKFAQQLAAHLDSTSTAYRSINYQAGNVSQIESLMRSDKENLLCIFNKNHGDLLSLMPVLNTIETTYSIFGFSEWLQMNKTLEDILTHNTYFYSQFQVDYDNQDVKNFLYKYTNAFDNDISKSIPHYNMLGYDITYYFVELALTEKAMPNKAEQHTRMLQNDFCFKRISNQGGYVNKSIFLINYKNQ
ncbi:MAG: LysM peptidoglycan-binding domain-containing protein [Paludibacteraceae bacterium]|nr:LysM peptidoglycan-binding domain-containing protein [Paludibacteraceae bacterium]